MKQQNRKELLQFLIITFGIMYGMGFTAIVFLPSIEKIFGPISNRNPLAMFLIYSPTISALIMTTAKEGSSGLWNLFKAAVRRTKPVYWIVSILFIPVLILVLGIVQPFIPLIETSFNPDIYLKTFPLILFSLEIFRDAGPLGEELGWRGYALPRLLEMHSPLKASLILSFIWTVFHFVSFLVPGTAQNSMNIVWFTFSIISMTFIMTWLYMKSGGNWVLSGVIPHYLLNIFISRGATVFGPLLCIIFGMAAGIIWIAFPVRQYKLSV